MANSRMARADYVESKIKKRCREHDHCAPAAGGPGPRAADLQDALLLMVDRNVIEACTAPNRPTAEELAALANRVKQERTPSRFGDATRQLVGHFQIQQHLGDHLGGVVETKTAAALNAALQRLGVLTAARILQKVHGPSEFRRCEYCPPARARSFGAFGPTNSQRAVVAVARNVWIGPKSVRSNMTSSGRRSPSPGVFDLLHDVALTG